MSAIVKYMCDWCCDEAEAGLADGVPKGWEAHYPRHICPSCIADGREGRKRVVDSLGRICTEALQIDGKQLDLLVEDTGFVYQAEAALIVQLRNELGAKRRNAG